MEKKWFFNTWLMLSISAGLGVLPFIVTYYCAEFVFIFLLPLFFIITKNDLYFKEGLFWGIIFYFFYFYGLNTVIIQHGHGDYRLFVTPMLIFYGALYVGLWFSGCTKAHMFLVRNSMFRNTTILKLCCWVCGSFIYFWFIDSGLFWVFEFYEGDQLRFPLLPLATRIEWLHLTCFFSRYGALFLLLIFSASCIYAFVEKKKWYLLVSILSFMPFLGGWLLPKNNQEPTQLLTSIACVIPKPHQNPFESMEYIAHLLSRCAEMPTVKTIFLPESSFQFPFNQWLSAISLWYDCLANDEKYIIFGSHRKENDFLFNTLYVLHDRRIIFSYDKNHALFFTERIPSTWSNLRYAKNLFLKDKEPFSQGKKCFFLNHQLLGTIIPYMCSDLFFQPLYLDLAPEQTARLLCLVNDSWFSHNYIPYLMYLHGKYKALYLKKDLFYVSYFFCHYITSVGISYPLRIIQ